MNLLPLTLFLVAFFLRGLLAQDKNDDDLNEHWEKYKEQYNKTYGTPEDEEAAKENFKDNMYDAMLHNMDDNNNYTKGIHEHSDKSTEEAIKILCATDIPEDAGNRTRRSFMTSARQARAASKNWVAEGKVSPVKNQGSCGSCWAFAAAQAIECQAAMRWNSMWTISPQQLVDCASSYGNHGCDGGWPDNAFNYMINEGGIVMESSYPYTGKVGTCNVDSNAYHFKVKDYVDVAADEDQVANSVYLNGPHCVAIHVDNDMMHYDSGVFHDEDCDKAVNHGVLLVGYGTTDDGQDYWLIKNSWGPSWGEDGYIRLARNALDMCRVASYASYPVLA